MARGGYRKPTNGAVVSPPGALSKRKATENVANERMTPNDGKYGERKAIENQKSLAPISKGVGTPNKIKFNSSMQVPGMPRLTDETSFPDQSSETGMPFGDGPTPAQAGLSLGTGITDSPQKRDLDKLSGFMPMIRAAANSEDAPESVRDFVRFIDARRPTLDAANRDYTQREV